jgi:hypothetical protein
MIKTVIRLLAGSFRSFAPLTAENNNGKTAQNSAFITPEAIITDFPHRFIRFA